MDNFRLVLASKSPRRQALIKELGFPVEVRLKEVEEVYPANIAPEDIPEYLANIKATPLLDSLATNEILVTSDTIVIQNGVVLEKPKDRADAIRMISTLSDSQHTVITGVALNSKDKSVTFATRTEVYFSALTEAEIVHYVDTYQPMDKAGAYGIQEWIGYIGVRKIDGCYYNVMGLPLHDLYRTLLKEFAS